MVQSISFETQEIYTNDIIFASAEVTDLDGDGILINYDWYVDGSLVKSGLSSSVDGSSYFQKNQEVLLVVTGSDTSLSSEVFVSEALLILNTKPTVPDIAMNLKGGVLHIVVPKVASTLLNVGQLTSIAHPKA